MNAADCKIVKKAVSECFGNSRFVYATPGTSNHSANFYGDTWICRLNRTDVAACIDVAYDGWNFGEDEDDPEFNRLQACIDAVLDDLQFDRPTE